MIPKHRSARRWLPIVLVQAALLGCGGDEGGAESDAASASADAGAGRDDRAPGRVARPPANGAESGVDDEVRDQDPNEDKDRAEEQAASSGSCGAGEFESTFAAIQEVIFERDNCANGMCHGAAAMGGLDLRADKAYASLVEVKSSNSSAFRVMPGEPDESFLYNKLRAATEPGSVEVEGSPMPSGAPPLSAQHLEAIRKWIEAGAPREGSIGDSVTGRSDSIAKLLGSCLPEATPVTIGALAPPPESEGLQLAMAPFDLPESTELEFCFAQY